MKKKVEEIAFPFVVSKGSVSVKIYRTPSHGCDSFTLSYYQDGKRKRPTFPTFERAKAEADVVVRKLASSDIDVLHLTSADRAVYLRARNLLDPLGVSLEVAAAEYAHVKPLLKGIPLSTAVMYYMRKHDGHVEGKLVKDVVSELFYSRDWCVGSAGAGCKCGGNDSA